MKYNEKDNLTDSQKQAVVKAAMAVMESDFKIMKAGRLVAKVMMAAGIGYFLSSPQKTLVVSMLQEEKTFAANTIIVTATENGFREIEFYEFIKTTYPIGTLFVVILVHPGDEENELPRVHLLINELEKEDIYAVEVEGSMAGKVVSEEEILERLYSIIFKLMNVEEKDE